MRNLLLILILATTLPFLAFAQSSNTGDDSGPDASATTEKWDKQDPNMKFVEDGSKASPGNFKPSLPGNPDCKDCQSKHQGNTRNTQAHNADPEMNATGDAEDTSTGKAGGSADKKP